MKAKKLLALLSVAVLITGCSNNLGDPGSSLITTDGNSSKTPSTDPSGDNNSAANQGPEEPITDEEKEEFTKIFQDFEYAGFLYDPFNDTSELDWDSILEQGAGLETSDLDENEVQLFLKANYQDQLYGTLYKITKSQLEEYSKTHAGVDFDPNSDSLTWTYIEETDSYYRQRYEFELSYEFECIEGTKQGNRYTLKFRDNLSVSNYGTYADRVLVLNKDGDNITVVSNAIMWEDNCDPDQTFDVELNSDEGPVRFITYNPGSDYGVEFVIIKDGKLRDSISSYISDGEDWGYLSSVSAISFFDYNADGIKDIVIIGGSDFGTKVVLYQSVEGHYEQLYSLPEKIEYNYGDSVTIDQIKSFLMDDNKDCVYNSYQDAYAQITRLHYLDDEEDTFALIYLDNDDIPELVAGHSGYEVSLYSYKNGHAVCYMHEWPYGAMGNTGYYYSPRNGVVFNTNFDYAGAIQYDSYMTVSSDGNKLDDDCSIQYFWFDDVDGDYYPSDEELESANYDTAYSTSYFDESGKGRSEEELKQEVERFEQYSYEDVCGRVSLSEILSQLGV